MTSFISPKEAMAAGEMGCHHATISADVLTQLGKLSYDGSKQPGEGIPKPMYPYLNAGPTPSRLAKLLKTDPLAAADWDGKLASTGIDYLANDGANCRRLSRLIRSRRRVYMRLLSCLRVGSSRARLRLRRQWSWCDVPGPWFWLSFL